MAAQQASQPDLAMSAPTAGSAPKDQTPGHPSFRRQRASRACETCHARKVRCDAASLGVPCTNCVAFQIECRIPPPKRKKSTAKRETDTEQTDTSFADAGESPSARSDTYPRSDGPARGFGSDKLGMNVPSAVPNAETNEAYAAKQKAGNGTYMQYMKPKFARAPIKEAGRVAYLGESSNLSLLVQEQHGTTDVVHYPLPENVRGTRARIDELDNVEIDILHQRGAFLLPPRALCDELVDAYFQWIAPIVPVINRSKFMRRYRDSKNPPSLLLLQSILLAGSRVCSNPQLMDANGSTTPAAMTFYKRAKALYDANYEDDRVTIVQALILMGWYWEGPEGKNQTTSDPIALAWSDLALDVTKNVFYWSRVAVIVAQGSGMHRSVEGSGLSRADKRLWKRIWWTLFTRDRSVAVALGRPLGINIEDADVEMITAEDFADDEVNYPAEYPPDPVHIQFFLNYVKLCEIMGLVLAQNYSVSSRSRRNNALDLNSSDIALADWLKNCPMEIRWEPQRHHFWSALLHANYYTTLCLLHRAHMPPAGSTAELKSSSGLLEETAYPSRTIAYQAAGMITSIIEALQQHDQIRYTPAFIVYSLFSALIMHVYQMRSSNQTIVAATQQRLNTCMTALREVSRVWLVAKMVHTLFESILGNKAFEERLQKAAGRRHAKARATNGASAAAKQKDSPASIPAADAQKRKFDDMEFGYSNGPPAPQMSYERSRPQSPALAEPRDPQAQRNSALSASPHTLLGASRPDTRPTTPFNQFSYPGTPPDLFLHTRNSPKISDDLWQNYQPGQLFPPDTSDLFSLSSPNQSMVDPALRGPTDQQQQQQQQQFAAAAAAVASQQQQQQQQGLANTNPTFRQQQPNNPLSLSSADTNMPQMYAPDALNAWSQMSGGAGGLAPRGADDAWSNNSGASGPIVPTTLNVGDWFEFFGIPSAELLANGGAGGLEGAYG